MTIERTPPPHPDTNRKLFVVPVLYVVQARHYVVALTEDEAKDRALATDYDALVWLGDNLLQADDGRLEFDDYAIVSVDLTGIKLDDTSRDPREHPDWQALPPRQ
jgi:hypothetical protein